MSYFWLILSADRLTLISLADRQLHSFLKPCAHLQRSIPERSPNLWRRFEKWTKGQRNKRGALSQSPWRAWVLTLPNRIFSQHPERKISQIFNWDRTLSVHVIIVTFFTCLFGWKLPNFTLYVFKSQLGFLYN